MVTRDVIFKNRRPVKELREKFRFKIDTYLHLESILAAYFHCKFNTEKVVFNEVEVYITAVESPYLESVARIFINGMGQTAHESYKNALMELSDALIAAKARNDFDKR